MATRKTTLNSLGTMLEQQAVTLNQIITMLGDVVDVFGKRFDKLDDEIAGVKSKVDGINRRLDTEAMQRTDLKLPRRVHELEEEPFGRSKHPKHVPL
jgi:hypothetical protein